MKKDQRITKILLAVLITLLFAAGCVLPSNLESPLAPTLAMPTETEAPVLEMPTAAPLPTLINSIPAVETDLSSPTPEAEKFCGQSGKMTLLFVGADVLGSSKPNGADAIRLIQADFDAQTIRSVTFPRDLVVQGASTNSAAQVQQKLGLSFYEAFTAANGTPKDKNAIGASVLAQLLRDNFGVEAQAYVTVQLDQFAAMVDTVGGVEVTLPAAVTTEHNVTFPAGAQTLNGSLATEYVRFLTPGGETARTARQNEVIKALQAKLININILPRVPALLAQFKEAFITDLSVEELTSLACLAVSMPRENVTFGAVSGADLVAENVPNVANVRAYMSTFLGE